MIHNAPNIKYLRPEKSRKASFLLNYVFSIDFWFLRFLFFCFFRSGFYYFIRKKMC